MDLTDFLIRLDRASKMIKGRREQEGRCNDLKCAAQEMGLVLPDGRYHDGVLNLIQALSVSTRRPISIETLIEIARVHAGFRDELV